MARVPEWLADAGRSLRGVMAQARHAPDRGLHRLRRADAAQRVAAAAPVGSVLFVCHGNVCRSPFAAAALARDTTAAGVRVQVRSAGFIGPGRQPPEFALRAAARRAIDLSSHRSSLIDVSVVLATDLLFVMDAAQADLLSRRFAAQASNVVVLGDLDPRPVTRRAIRDPWGAEEQVFDECYDRIQRCVSELVALISDRSPSRAGG